MQEVVAPVAEVEDGENGGKDDPRDDVDLLGAGGKPVKPRLQEVVVPLLRLVHDDLAGVQLRARVQHHLVAACTPMAVAAARTAQERLLQCKQEGSLYRPAACY